MRSHPVVTILDHDHTSGSGEELKRRGRGTIINTRSSSSLSHYTPPRLPSVLSTPRRRLSTGSQPLPLAADGPGIKDSNDTFGKKSELNPRDTSIEEQPNVPIPRIQEQNGMGGIPRQNGAGGKGEQEVVQGVLLTDAGSRTVMPADVQGRERMRTDAGREVMRNDERREAEEEGRRRNNGRRAITEVSDRGVVGGIGVRTLNTHLVCGLCKGYLINATTITSCLHAFCRSCIVRHLKSSARCPTCRVQDKDLSPTTVAQLRFDRQLQMLVYKIVPSLHASELKRQRDFRDLQQLGSKRRDAVKDDDGVEKTGQEEDEKDEEAEDEEEEEGIGNSRQWGMRLKRRRPAGVVIGEWSGEWGGSNAGSHRRHSSCLLRTAIYSGHERIRVNLSHSTFTQIMKLVKNLGPISRRVRRKADVVESVSTDSLHYLLCPAKLTVRHLKKFVRLKFDLGTSYQVELFHTCHLLINSFTLMDVAYVFCTKKVSRLQLQYIVYNSSLLKSNQLVSRSVQVNAVTREVTNEYQEPINVLRDQYIKDVSAATDTVTSFNVKHFDTKRGRERTKRDILFIQNPTEVVEPYSGDKRPEMRIKVLHSDIEPLQESVEMCKDTSHPDASGHAETNSLLTDNMLVDYVESGVSFISTDAGKTNTSLETVLSMANSRAFSHLKHFNFTKNDGIPEWLNSNALELAPVSGSFARSLNLVVGSNEQQDSDADIDSELRKIVATVTNKTSVNNDDITGKESPTTQSSIAGEDIEAEFALYDISNKGDVENFVSLSEEGAEELRNTTADLQNIDCFVNQTSSRFDSEPENERAALNCNSTEIISFENQPFNSSVDQHISSPTALKGTHELYNANAFQTTVSLSVVQPLSVAITSESVSPVQPIISSTGTTTSKIKANIRSLDQESSPTVSSTQCELTLLMTHGKKQGNAPSQASVGTSLQNVNQSSSTGKRLQKVQKNVASSGTAAFESENDKMISSSVMSKSTSTSSSMAKPLPDAELQLSVSTQTNPDMMRRYFRRKSKPVGIFMPIKEARRERICKPPPVKNAGRWSYIRSRQLLSKTNKHSTTENLHPSTNQPTFLSAASTNNSNLPNINSRLLGTPVSINGKSAFVITYPANRLVTSNNMTPSVTLLTSRVVDPLSSPIQSFTTVPVLWQTSASGGHTIVLPKANAATPLKLILSPTSGMGCSTAGWDANLNTRGIALSTPRSNVKSSQGNFFPDQAVQYSVSNKEPRGFAAASSHVSHAPLNAHPQIIVHTIPESLQIHNGISTRAKSNMSSQPSPITNVPLLVMRQPIPNNRIQCSKATGITESHSLNYNNLTSQSVSQASMNGNPTLPVSFSSTPSTWAIHNGLSVAIVMASTSLSSKNISQTSAPLNFLPPATVHASSNSDAQIFKHQNLSTTLPMSTIYRASKSLPQAVQQPVFAPSLASSHSANMGQKVISTSTVQCISSSFSCTTNHRPTVVAERLRRSLSNESAAPTRLDLRQQLHVVTPASLIEAIFDKNLQLSCSNESVLPSNANETVSPQGDLSISGGEQPCTTVVHMSGCHGEQSFMEKPDKHYSVKSKIISSDCPVGNLQATSTGKFLMDTSLTKMSLPAVSSTKHATETKKKKECIHLKNGESLKRPLESSGHVECTGVDQPSDMQNSENVKQNGTCRQLPKLTTILNPKPIAQQLIVTATSRILNSLPDATTTEVSADYADDSNLDKFNSLVQTAAHFNNGNENQTCVVVLPDNISMSSNQKGNTIQHSPADFVKPINPAAPLTNSATQPVRSIVRASSVALPKKMYAYLGTSLSHEHISAREKGEQLPSTISHDIQPPCCSPCLENSECPSYYITSSTNNDEHAPPIKQLRQMCRCIPYASDLAAPSKTRSTETRCKLAGNHATEKILSKTGIDVEISGNLLPIHENQSLSNVHRSRFNERHRMNSSDDEPLELTVGVLPKSRYW